MPKKSIEAITAQNRAGKKTTKAKKKPKKTEAAGKDAKKAKRKRSYTAAELAEIERQYIVAKWYIDLCNTSNSVYMPLFGDKSRYLVLMGGGGSGKSIFAGRKILERVTSEAGHRWLVIRKVARTLRESCFKQLTGQLAEHYADIEYSKNLSDMTIKFSNGSEILFAGVDDVEKLKSIYNITGIWIEEASELSESDFNQLDIRLRGETAYYKQIILSFNPISIVHWLKRRFFDFADERATTLRTTYKDNRFLDEESKRVLESFKDTDEYYYSVYCLGEWGVTGRTVFVARLVAEQLQKDIKPIRRGMFKYDEINPTKIDNIEFEDDGAGFIKIYKEPEVGAPYVIGGDTAGEGSDKFVAQVIDNRTGEQVAKLRHTFDEDLFTRQVYCLGMYYNAALIGIETNFSTYPVKLLQFMQYPRQYVREATDTYTGKVKQSFGFRTDGKTRNVAISGLIKVMREHPELVVDRDTLEEMMTFVRNEEYRPEAEDGAHDDCVMALAIAHAIRHQQRYTAEVANENKAKWTADMWEDYRNAGKEGKAYLIKKWGDPN